MSPTGLPKPSVPNPPPNDVEYREACRIAAWAVNSWITEHWEDGVKEHAYSEGWPDSVVPDTYLAERVGHDPTNADAEPRPDRTLLHKMLGG